MDQTFTFTDSEPRKITGKCDLCYRDCGEPTVFSIAELFPESSCGGGWVHVFLCQGCIGEFKIMPSIGVWAIYRKLHEAHLDHAKAVGYSETVDPVTGNVVEHGTPPAWWKEADEHQVTVYFCIGFDEPYQPLPWKVTEKRGDTETQL